MIPTMTVAEIEDLISVHGSRRAAAAHLGISDSSLKRRHDRAIAREGRTPRDVAMAEPADPVELVGLRRQLARATDKNRELSAQLGTNIKDTNLLEDVAELVTPILDDYPPYVAVVSGAKLHRRPRHTAPIEIVAYLADWHIGEVIHPSEVQDHNEYGPDVAAKRIEHAANVLAEWVENYSAMHRIDRITFALMGDMVNNAGLLHSDQSTDYARVLAQALDASLLARQMISPFVALPKVRIRVVTTAGGNHGRSTRKMPSGPAAAQTSWDQVMYEHLAAMMQGSGVDFQIGRAYSHTIDIAGSTVWLAHGDAIKGGGGALGIPVYGTKRASDAAVMASVVEAMRTSSAGKIVQHGRVAHFHQEVMIGMPTGTFKIVPSIKGTGPWELAVLGKTSQPEMLIEAFHPEYGIIGSHTVDCSKPSGEGFTWGAMRSTSPACDLTP